MQVFQKNDKVQVLQNVGNIGPHIRTIDGDFPETFSADDNCVNKNCKYAAECKKVFCLPPP